MKVLIINTVSFRLNGITSVIMNYYRKMDKDKMITDFLVTNEISNDYFDEITSTGSKVYKLNRKGNIIAYFINLYKLMRSNNYDIVHIHGNSATVSIETVAAYLAKVPVRIVHSHNTTCSHKRAHKILYPIMKRTYTHGVACGEAAGRWLFKDQKFDIIKNGIDLNVFTYDENLSNKFKERINYRGRIVIGHVGNFVEQKNHNFLIDIFNELLKKDKNYELLLIGDGPLIQDIKNKVSSLGIEENVCFLGKTNEVSNYLQAVDIFLLPSHYEGLPVVSIEAQALGLPCLISDKVSEEVSITENVKFLPIDNIEHWINAILMQKSVIDNNRINSHNSIRAAGYDIYENSYSMKLLYKKYLEEVK